MSLIVDQIIYTSFAEIGYQLFSSPELSPMIEKPFLQNIVFQYWNAYDPPHSDYRAVYLYQLSAHQTLFGWLYNDGADDVGRAHTPYFVSYYLAEELQHEKLQNILSCLELGPFALLGRQIPPTALDKLTLPPGFCYEPARPGVQISDALKQSAFQQLDHQELLRLFVPLQIREHPLTSDQTIAIAHPSSGLDSPQSWSSKVQEIEQIFEDLSTQPIGFRSAALIRISQDKNFFVISRDIDRDLAVTIVRSSLEVLNSITHEFDWQDVKQISLHTAHDLITIVQISPDVILLLRTGKVLKGLLDGKIKQLVQQLRR